ncbi:MAG: hypothetical protein ACI4MQ_05575 [Candidatus Coproplasma sp.]
MKKQTIAKTIAVLSLCCAVFSFTACNKSGSDGNGNSSTGNNGESSQYSQLVMNILNDRELNSLIDRAKEDTSLYSSAYFDPHPYAFLEKQGEPVERVKSGELSCSTTSYVDPDEPNSLYMMIYVENDDDRATVNYYSEYILKYTLTDKEMADYKMLHGGYQAYIQAVFMNNEIAENKTATIISHTYTTTYAHSHLKESFAEQKSVTGSEYIGTDRVDCILKDYDLDTQTFNVVVYERVDYYTSMTDTVKMGTLPLGRGLSRLGVNNNVFCGPFEKGQYKINNSKLDEYQQNIKTVTLYNSQNVDLWRNLAFLDLNDKK